MNSTILFDGDCGFCDRWMKFVRRFDSSHFFRLVSLQSDEGQALLQKFSLPTKDFNSVVLIEEGRVYQRSTAILRILRRLNFPLNLLYAFIIVPPPIRDGFYRLVARGRSIKSHLIKVLSLGIVLLGPSDAVWGATPMSIEVCAARMYALAYYHRISSVSEAHTEKAIETVRRFRWRRLEYRDNNLWHHQSPDVLSSDYFKESDRVRLGKSLRGLEVMWEQPQETTAEGERRILAGVRIEGKEAILNHFAEIDSALNDLRNVRGFGLANNFYAIGMTTSVLVGGGFVLGKLVHPLFLLPAVFGMYGAASTLLYYPLMFDYRARRDFQKISSMLSEPAKERFFYSGRNYFVKPDFAELWNSRSLDASIVNNEFLHQQQVLRLDPAKDAHLVVFDRLLVFEEQEDGSLIPVLTEFIRFTRKLPPSPEPTREPQASLLSRLVPRPALARVNP